MDVLKPHQIHGNSAVITKCDHKCRKSKIGTKMLLTHSPEIN